MKLIKVTLSYEKSPNDNADTPEAKEIQITRDRIIGVEWPREVRLAAMILEWLREEGK